MTNEENKSLEGLEKTVGDWVIVHEISKEISVGKLSEYSTNVIFLDVFHGSSEKGSLVSSRSLPYTSIEKVYNKECEVIYENPKFKGEDK